jgi:crossover junction endodeoxyribonuclease RusA
LPNITSIAKLVMPVYTGDIPIGRARVNKVVEIVIPRPPSVNRLWRVGRGKMFRSRQYVDWMNECMAIVKKAGIPAIKGKYKIMLRVVRPDKRRRDIDNLSKAAQDFLQHAGIIEDDCLCEAIYCKWVEKGPSFRINIYPVRGTNELSEGTARPLQSRARKNKVGSTATAKSPAQAYAEAIDMGGTIRTQKGRVGAGRRGR